MKKEKALALLEGFPEITPEIEKDIKNTLTQYLITDGKKAYCTWCEEIIEIDEAPGHRETVHCPHCDKQVVSIRNHHNFCGSVVESVTNAVVFLSSPENENLYVRCFTVKLFFNAHQLMPCISFEETQRYVFTDKQAVRYGRDYHWEQRGSYWIKHKEDQWQARTKFTEPQFDDKRFDYDVFNAEAIRNTYLRHCEAPKYSGKYMLEYLRFFQKHPGAERLIKSGLGDYVRQSVESRNGMKERIKWDEHDVHKMLGVSRDVCGAIRCGRISLQDYLSIKDHFPNENLETLITFNRVVKYSYGALNYCTTATAEQEKTIVKFLAKSRATLSDYYDYLRLAAELGYDTAGDRSVKFPPHFAAAHDRLEGIRRALEEERKANELRKCEASFNQRICERKKLEFSCGDYIIIQPKSISDIVNEGKVLSHCVGGYAERHAEGKLTIMFLRKKSKPDKPYYTIEVSNDYHIVQCRGYKNNWESSGGKPKPQEIKNVEKQYQDYLDGIAAKSKKKARKKTA